MEIQSADETAALIRRLGDNGIGALDLSANEAAKLHFRHTVGGRARAENELAYRFEFPERPGALMNFLTRMGEMGPEWNISMFHYRNHGADVGRVFVGVQVPPGQRRKFARFLAALGYPHAAETDNPAYRMFLREAPAPGEGRMIPAGEKSPAVRGSKAGMSRRAKSQSAQWRKRQERDPFVRAAREQGYRSRAAFKLLQIHQVEALIRPGDTIADLGAAPGGWTQVATRLASPGGNVVAADLLPMQPVAGAVLVQGDFAEEQTRGQIADALQNPPILSSPTWPPILPASPPPTWRAPRIWRN